MVFVRRVALVLVGLGICLCGATAARADEVQYFTVDPIKASYDQENDATFYSVKFQYTNDIPFWALRREKFNGKWSLKPPTNDPTCRDFTELSGVEAIWNHGECNHSGLSLSAGHPGTVRDEITDVFGGKCVVRYYGTFSGTGETPVCSPGSPTPPRPAVPGGEKGWKSYAEALEKNLNRAGNYIALAAGFLALFPEPLVTKGAAGLVAFLAVCLKADGTTIGFIADLIDPFDPHYKVVARPVIPHVLHVGPSNGVSPAMASAANALIDNVAHLLGYDNALIIAIDRAGSARQRGDHRARMKQLQAASRYANKAAGFVALEPALLRRLVTAMVKHHAQTTWSQGQLSQGQAEIAQHGLPPALSQTLGSLGIDRTTIDDYAVQLVNVVLPASRDLTALLSNPALNRQFRGAAAGLRQLGGVLARMH